MGGVVLGFIPGRGVDRGVVSKGMDTVVSICEVTDENKEGRRDDRTLKDNRINVVRVREGTISAGKDRIFWESMSCPVKQSKATWTC